MIGRVASTTPGQIPSQFIKHDLNVVNPPTQSYGEIASPLQSGTLAIELQKVLPTAGA
jgi:hypothetical protein